MPLSEKILKHISDQSSEVHTLILDGKEGINITDEDIIILSNSLSQNSPINYIQIKNHHLTVKSHRSLLDLIQNHQNIRSFHCDLIKPLTLANSIYNKAIRNILAERRQETINDDKVFLLNRRS